MRRSGTQTSSKLRLCWVIISRDQGSSQTGTPFPFFFIQQERRSRCFFFCILQLLTVIFHGSPYTPYTNIKTSAQNAPKCTIARQKIKKKILEGGTAPSHTPPPLGRGIPPPRPHPRRRLRRSAFLFLFIYDSNTARVLKRHVLLHV